nr:MAG TPA: hypothetical protein [Caudoviricetes sp.]
MKLTQLASILGNANVVVTNKEQDELFIQGVASQAVESEWKDYEVIKVEKLEDIHEVFEADFFYEITLDL